MIVGLTLSMAVVTVAALIVGLPKIYSSWISDAGVAPLRTFGSVGAGDGQFKSPKKIALDDAGDVYVADTINHRVQVFDADGRFLRKWGSAGVGDGQFTNLGGIALDGARNVYVVDADDMLEQEGKIFSSNRSGHRVQVFDSSGRFQRQWGSKGSADGQFQMPQGIAIDVAGNVYVADALNHRVQVFDTSGRYLRQWGSKGIGDGQFQFPQGITLDVTGNVYVVDWASHRVQVFDANGRFLRQWGSKGSGDGKFKFPRDISVTVAGEVYVADTGNHRVQVFDPNGRFLRKWGRKGSGDGQFKNPMGITTNGSDVVYVTDVGNHRVQVFAPTGATVAAAPAATASPETAPMGTERLETLIDRKACAQESSLRSLDGQNPTAINFVNLTSQAIRIYWLDYQGRRQFYHVLQPTQGYTQSTYLTHPWMTTTKSGECLAIYLPADILRKVVVTTTTPLIIRPPTPTFEPRLTNNLKPTGTPRRTATPTPVPTAIPTAAPSRVSAPTLGLSPTPTPTLTPQPTHTPRAVVATTLWDSKIAFVSTRDGNPEIYVMNPDGSDQTRLTYNSADDAELAWSPEGGRIAFFSNRDGNDEIYVMNADGSEQTRLTRNETSDSSPAWSPNGQRIVFESDREGNSDIYIMKTDGSAQTRLTNHPAAEWHPSWSPDGRLIAFASARYRFREVYVPDIYVLNPDGTRETRLTRSQAGKGPSGPVWSPDGNKIASHVFGGSACYSIEIMNADGAGRTRLTNDCVNYDSNPSWSPDGSRLAFQSPRNGNFEIYVMNGDGSGQTRLTDNPANDWDPAWSPLLQGPTATPQPTSVAVQVGCAQGQVDINSAPVEELDLIIHIGSGRAAELVQLRPFSSLDDLIRINNIGMSRLADIKAQGLACIGG